MKTITIPLSPHADPETFRIEFVHPKETLNIEEAAQLGEQLFALLYSHCPSILLRSLEATLILHSPKIQELADKANRWDDYYLQRSIHDKKEED